MQTFLANVIKQVDTMVIYCHSMVIMKKREREHGNKYDF
jgi:hypothetical protein